ncbi:MAG: ribosomal protein S18-alanine N-acetyltransferase [Marivita sp.]|uniref:ribosomal protein S18-alanine N-acetyltransferase n=1 Tax=Marivita sp. TaxID=2003365 RepID=UPI003EF9CF44
MTPDAFAAIMDRAYVQMRPWSAQDIADTLANRHVQFLTHPQGGLIAQLVADECEILAIATNPDAQRQGIASALMQDLIALAETRNAARIFLEVAEQNHPARAFYALHGFAPLGMRRAYYTLRNGTKDDALLLSRPVAQRHAHDTPTSQGT